jgi:CHASE2 domain-containing sensor protein
MKTESKEVRTARRWTIICVMSVIICLVVAFFSALQKQWHIVVAMSICAVLQCYNSYVLWKQFNEEKKNHRRF